MSKKYNTLVQECIELRRRQVRHQAKELLASGLVREIIPQVLAVNDRFLSSVLEEVP